jgi:hypothetical protein
VCFLLLFSRYGYNGILRCSEVELEDPEAALLRTPNREALIVTTRCAGLPYVMGLERANILPSPATATASDNRKKVPTLMIAEM